MIHVVFQLGFICGVFTDEVMAEKLVVILRKVWGSDASLAGVKYVSIPTNRPLVPLSGENWNEWEEAFPGSTPFM